MYCPKCARAINELNPTESGVPLVEFPIEAEYAAMMEATGTLDPASAAEGV